MLKENENQLIGKQVINYDCMIKMSEECKHVNSEVEIILNAASKKYNMTFDSLESVLQHTRSIIDEKRKNLNENIVQFEKIRLIVSEKNKKYIWPLLNALFVIGGMIGALTSKYVLDYLGRKKGILFNCLFGMIASVIVFISLYLKSPVCLMISRLLFGIQGGMACTLM